LEARNRLGAPLLVLALLGGTAAAFAYTEGLKQTTSPIGGTRVTNKVFSPACRCPTSFTAVSFVLRRADHLTVSVEDASGRVVKVLLDDRPVRRGFRRFAWHGLLADGRRAPDGRYKLRIDLSDADRVIQLPNPITVDTKPPTIAVVGRPEVGHRFVVVRYRVSEPARAMLFVAGRRVLLTYRRPLDGTVRLERSRLTASGPLSIAAVDPAGNVSARRPLGVRVSP